MSKLVKITEYPFTGDQPASSAADHTTIPSRDAIIEFYRTHERMSWSLTELLDLDWRAICIEALMPADVWVVESAMLVESNNPDYVANLLEYFQADQDVCDFIMMWGMEEWKHYYALRDYLTKVQTALAARECHDGEGQPDQRLATIEASVHCALGEKVAAVREASTHEWGIPAHYVAAQVVANTTLQEFVTAEFYRHHAGHTEEPTLAKIELLLAKDETRHEQFYEQKLKDCLAANPEVLPLVVDALKEFGMPGAYLLDDYNERRAAMEEAAFPTLAEKKAAFVRLFSKVSRIVGRDGAMQVFTEGNYFSNGANDSSRKKLRPELIARLITRKFGA